MGKIVPFAVPVKHRLEQFSFLYEIQIVSIHCQDKTERFPNLSIVPHTSKRGLIFIVMDNGREHSVEQFFVPELINNYN